MRLLPRTHSLLLRLAVIGLAAACVWLSAVAISRGTSGEPGFAVLSLMLWLPLATGLWLLMPWARVLALVILWVLVFSVPFGEISAVATINAPEPPGPIWEPLLYRVAPVVILAAFFIEVLRAYKAEFRRPHVTDAEATGSRLLLPRSWFFWCLAVVAAPSVLVELANFEVELNGGCVSASLSFRSVPALACVGVGTLLFLRAAPASANWRQRIVRAVVYALAALSLLWNVQGYLMVLTNLC
jgi:hypothetical protein